MPNVPQEQIDSWKRQIAAARKSLDAVEAENKGLKKELDDARLMHTPRPAHSRLSMAELRALHGMLANSHVQPGSLPGREDTYRIQIEIDARELPPQHFPQFYNLAHNLISRHVVDLLEQSIRTGGRADTPRTLPLEYPYEWSQTQREQLQRMPNRTLQEMQRHMEAQLDYSQRDTYRISPYYWSRALQRRGERMRAATDRVENLNQASNTGGRATPSGGESQQEAPPQVDADST